MGHRVRGGAARSRWRRGPYSGWDRVAFSPCEKLSSFRSFRLQKNSSAGASLVLTLQLPPLRGLVPQLDKGFNRNATVSAVTAHYFNGGVHTPTDAESIAVNPGGATLTIHFAGAFKVGLHLHTYLVPSPPPLSASSASRHSCGCVAGLHGIPYTLTTSSSTCSASYCTRTHSMHPAFWPGHSFPLAHTRSAYSWCLLNVYRCTRTHSTNTPPRPCLLHFTSPPRLSAVEPATLGRRHAVAP